MRRLEDYWPLAIIVGLGLLVIRVFGVSIDLLARGFGVMLVLSGLAMIFVLVRIRLLRYIIASAYVLVLAFCVVEVIGYLIFMHDISYVIGMLFGTVILILSIDYAMNYSAKRKPY